MVLRRRVHGDPRRLVEGVEGVVAGEQRQLARRVGLERRRPAKGHALPRRHHRRRLAGAPVDPALAADDPLHARARQPRNLLAQEAIEPPAAALALDDELVLDAVGAAAHWCTLREKV